MVHEILDETADVHSSEYKKTRMTAFISSEAQKIKEGQTDKVSYREDDH